MTDKTLNKSCMIFGQNKKGGKFKIQNNTFILTPEALLVVALLNYSCKLTWCLSFLTLFFSFSSNIATSIDNMLSLFNKA